MSQLTILTGDCRTVLPTLESQSVQCVVTSPPYFGLRDYSQCGCVKTRPREKSGIALVPRGGHRPETVEPSEVHAKPIPDPSCVKCHGTGFDKEINRKQIGQEKTPQAYVRTMRKVFAAIWRVLRDDGTVWLNLGDSFAAGGCGGNPEESPFQMQKKNRGSVHGNVTGKARVAPVGYKRKDLLGIPWAVAFALRKDGWYLRSDIIWCLSGGTWIYARTQKGDMPMMLRDAARLDPGTVKLWNGEKWTQVLGWSRTSRNADELEIVLRSGERIACTPTHQFQTSRGLLRASDILVGDTLQRVNLPEPDAPKRPVHIGLDAAWFAGLYLAEGSMSGETIQIAGHASQDDRLARVREIARSYSGTVTCTVDGNRQSIRVYGRLLVALVNELVTGSTAKDKALASVCWRYGNEFLRAMLDGYLSGDGHNDEGNRRWRLGFTRNYNLERDLRTLSARLGFHLTLQMVFVDGFGERWPAFKGEIRFERSGHHNEKNTGEVMEIRRSRCREVYDVGVEGEPHLFALASGILTHNSKPNCMPESVQDRPTRSHEYIFLLTKRERYYYNHEAIKEPPSPELLKQIAEGYNGHATKDFANGMAQDASATKSRIIDGYRKRIDKQRGHSRRHEGFNERWDGLTKAEQMACGSNKRDVWTVAPASFNGAHFATFPPDLIKPCILAGTKPGDMVLDPFFGSGCTGMVALELGRRCTGIELNPEYIKLAEQRTNVTHGLCLY